jgi:hypothetical protein
MSRKMMTLAVLCLTTLLTTRLHGEVLHLGGSGSCAPGGPQIARHFGGGFVAAWVDGPFVHLRRFDRYGAPATSERTIPGGFSFTPRDVLAVAADGTTALAAWEDGIWWLHLLDSDLLPVAPPVEVQRSSRSSGPLVAVDTGGGFVAAGRRDQTLVIGRFNRQGEPIGPTREAGPLSGRLDLTDLVVQPDGDLWLLSLPEIASVSSLSWSVQLFRVAAGTSEFEVRNEVDFGLTAASLAAGAGDQVALALGTGQAITLIRLDDTLEPVAPPSRVAELSGVVAIEELELASDPAGNLLAAWALGPERPDEPQVIHLQTLTPEGRPAGPEARFTTAPLQVLFLPDLSPAAVEAGEILVAWGSGPRSPEDDCQEGTGPFAVRTPLGGLQTLLLQEGRFRVPVEWQDQLNGGTGAGHAIPDTPDSGGFWFFDPANTELRVKVLDGRPVNGHFWFFYGALSNVGYRITVTDQLTGRTRTYDNPQGRLASFADTMAFPGGSSP